MQTERRSCLRHKVHGPVFASFDGVTGGMILDLSEQGLSMQSVVPLTADRRVRLRLDLPDYDLPASEAHLETTGYIAWADALGRSGVRFSELPAEARQRLDRWLVLNDEAPSQRAPKLNFDQAAGRRAQSASDDKRNGKLRSISLEAGSAEAGADQAYGVAAANTMQYEFQSLGSDLNAGLETIAERARTLLRGTGAAIAIINRGRSAGRDGIGRDLISKRMNSANPSIGDRSNEAGWKGALSQSADADPAMLCRASVGTGGPPLGTRVDVSSGFSGACIRSGKALRCDDTATDSRVDAEICKKLGIRSIAAAPIRYEREVVGLVEVFSSHSFAFDEGDLAVLERLAQTAILMVRQSHFEYG